MKNLAFILVLALVEGVVYAASPAKTPTERVNLRLRQYVLQIERETHLGRLTKDQAKTLKGQVEAIRKAEIAELKQNGTKTLTDAQLAQLNGQLNTLSKSIPIR